MGLVAVLEAGSVVEAHGGTVRVVRQGAVLHTVRLHEVRELQLHGAVELTSGARNLLLRHGVDVAFFTGLGHYRGRLVAADAASAARRLAWYACVLDPHRRLSWARELVLAKVENARHVLLRRQQAARSEVLATALAALRRMAASVQEAVDLDTLRGLEGSAAVWAFRGLGAALSNPALPFSGRSRRPPTDPVNALLSYGYALLVAETERAVRRVGLDPAVGLFHVPGRGAPALALDLVEPVRPVVDRLVMTLVNRGQLGPEDFREPTPEERSDEGLWEAPAVYLGDLARKLVLRTLEAELGRRAPHPEREDRWALRDLLVEQARSLARLADDPASTPFRAIRLAGTP